MSAGLGSPAAIATDRPSGILPRSARGEPADGGPRRVRVGIIGATGYVGGELIRLLSRHPNVRIVESAAGVVMHAVEDEYDLDFVLRVGKTDPAPSLPFDPPGYAALVLEKWPMLNRFVA